jgi:hypothetical protein
MLTISTNDNILRIEGRETKFDLVKKGVLERKHLYKEHHGHNYSPKNRTYYYRLDREELSQLAIKNGGAE